MIIKSDYKAILGLITELIPITINYFGDQLMKLLEYMQKRTIRAIFIALFFTLNEIIIMSYFLIKLNIFYE